MCSSPISTISIDETFVFKIFWQKASELLENLEEIFPWYYMHTDVCSSFKSLTTKLYITLYERVNIV